MKRVRIKPTGYLGMVLFIIGILGADILSVADKYLRYGFIALGIIGLALLIKGKEIYESHD